MRSLLPLLLAGQAAGLSEEYTRANAGLLFENFKHEHGKKYASADEESLRSKIFLANMIKAAQLEKENPRATFGASKFADLHPNEFKSYHNLKVQNETSPHRWPPNTPPLMFSEADVAKALAASVDWRSKGAVVQVKDQKQCGSCWAFSSTGGIEGQWFLAGNKLTSVSEQELVSCDKIDDGCGGGLMDSAYKWLVTGRGGKNTGKIVTEKAYPYTSGGGSSGSCKSVKGMEDGATIKGHKDVTPSEPQMAAYVSASGPLPIAVDAQGQ